MRPTHIDDVLGQQHILGTGKPLRRAIDSDALHSMVLWGPPGVGKTTLARLLARHAGARFESLSAVLAGVKDIRGAVERAKSEQHANQRQSVLFIDEVHRFNKAQQDAFLPFVEDGTIVFVGATTENPSFELNNALLSRSRVYVLRSLLADDLVALLQRALNTDAELLELELKVDLEGLTELANAADGDARRALNLLELAANLASASRAPRVIDKTILLEVLSGSVRRFDKQGDAYYDQISALHKSVRGSSPDAALYWLCRMLDGGCEPLYIARRMLRMASEDIGLAEPRALSLCLDAWDSVQRLGSPEGELALAHAAVYLACAPKSNAVYAAFNTVRKEVSEQPSYEVPLHLRNAPTQLMKSLDHGRDYRYAHDEPHAYAAGESYLPEELERRQYYFPTDRGLEKRIAEKLEFFRKLDREALARK